MAELGFKRAGRSKPCASRCPPPVLSGPREPTVDVKWESERPSDFHFRDTMHIDELSKFDYSVII